jgi:hypothetical protein
VRLFSQLWPIHSTQNIVVRKRLKR